MTSIRNLIFGIMWYIDTRYRWRLWGLRALYVLFFAFLLAAIFIASVIGGTLWLIYGPGPG